MGVKGARANSSPEFALAPSQMTSDPGATPALRSAGSHSRIILVGADEASDEVLIGGGAADELADPVGQSIGIRPAAEVVLVVERHPRLLALLTDGEAEGHGVAAAGHRLASPEVLALLVGGAAEEIAVDGVYPLDVGAAAVLVVLRAGDEARLQLLVRQA